MLENMNFDNADNFDDLEVTTKEQELKIIAKALLDAREIAYGRMKTYPMSDFLDEWKDYIDEVEKEDRLNGESI